MQDFPFAGVMREADNEVPVFELCGLIAQHWNVRDRACRVDLC